MIAIILGPDAGLAHTALKRCLNKQDPSGDSTTMINGASEGIRAVVNAVSSVGFFSDGRVVVVEGLISRLGKQGAKDGGATPDWAGLFKSVPEANTLVLYDPDLRDLPSLTKKSLPKDASVELSRPPRGPQLVSWISNYAKSACGEIDNKTAQYLAMTLFPQGWAAEPRNPLYDRPPDMELLQNEIDKLVTAAYPEPITRETIDMLTMREEQDQIFGFLDAAAAGNVPTAMQELEKLIAVSEDPGKLLAQLLGNLEISTVISAGTGHPAEAIGKDIALSNPRRVHSLQQGLRGMSSGVAQRRVGIARDADRRLKTGEVRDPLDALYDTILGIAHMRREAAVKR